MSITSHDPRTGDVVATVDPTSPADLERALAAARAAAPVLARSAPGTRTALLRGLADALDAARDELVALADRETGLGAVRLTGEVGRTSGQLRLFAEVVEEGSYLQATIDHAVPDAAVPRPDLRRLRVALGPVLVFAASNFPLAFSVLGGDTASALAAGCPVLVKAHDGHLALSLRVAALAAGVVAAQGLPAGVFGLVTGLDAGREALRDPRVRAAGFTGSTAGGRALADLAAARPDPIPFHGELGSINPVVVTRDAAAERGPALVRAHLASYTLGSGQFCTKPGLVLLPAGHGLHGHVAEAVAALPPQQMLLGRIADAHAAGLAPALAHGAHLVAEGAAPTAPGAWARARALRVDAAAFLDSPAVFTEECFGPTALYVDYADDAELFALLQQVEGSLTGTVHTAEADTADVGAYLEALAARCGRVLVNGWPTGVAVTWAQHHGGPWPSSTAVGTTSVGAHAIERWVRPVAYQDAPAAHLPAPVRDDNPWGVPQRVDGRLPTAG